MKTLLTIALASALLSPAAALADTTTATTAAPTTQASTATAATATASATSTGNAAAVAMTKHQNVKDTSFGHVANDDRQGFARIQEEARQLGASN